VLAASSSRLRSDIIAAFPKLQNTDFELLKANGGGSGRTLVRILEAAKIPDLVHINSLRVGLIYIRPFSNIVRH